MKSVQFIWVVFNLVLKLPKWNWKVSDSTWRRYAVHLQFSVREHYQWLFYDHSLTRLALSSALWWLIYRQNATTWALLPTSWGMRWRFSAAVSLDSKHVQVKRSFVCHVFILSAAEQSCPYSECSSASFLDSSDFLNSWLKIKVNFYLSRPCNNFKPGGCFPWWPQGSVHRLVYASHSMACIHDIP